MSKPTVMPKAKVPLVLDGGDPIGFALVYSDRVECLLSEDLMSMFSVSLYDLGLRGRAKKLAKVSLVTVETGRAN